MELVYSERPAPQAGMWPSRIPSGCRVPGSHLLAPSVTLLRSPILFSLAAAVLLGQVIQIVPVFGASLLV